MDFFLFFGKGDGYSGGDPTEEEEREMAEAANDLGGQRGSEVGIAGARNNNGGRRRRKNRKKSRSSSSSSSSSRAENSHWNNGTCGQKPPNL